jgi:hypothetical protein
LRTIDLREKKLSKSDGLSWLDGLTHIDGNEYGNKLIITSARTFLVGGNKE